MTSSTDSVVTSSARAEIGVIGGSGFYEFLSDSERVSITTPFGDPSDDVVIGDLGGRRVAFLARHGQGHRFPPHRVNYRANLWKWGKKANEVMPEMISLCDLAIGNEEDADMVFGIKAGDPMWVPPEQRARIW